MSTTDPAVRENATEIVRNSLKRRYAKEKRFRLFGVIAIVASLSFLAVLLITITLRGLPAFKQTFIKLDVTLDAETLGVGENPDIDILRKANYDGTIKKSLLGIFPDVSTRKDKKALYKLVSKGAQYDLQNRVMTDPLLIGETLEVWLPVGDDTNGYLKGNIDTSLPEKKRRFKDNQEMAGIKGSLFGSMLTLLVTLTLSFPVAVATAIYLEEFAPKNRWTDLIEVNINNLAAVPSIVFGLLGLAIFINFAALKSVPPSIRDAALGLGASKLQVVFHHVLPLAMPGILTGTIIGMAQALGETAPLLMIGMVAFIVDVPTALTDPATVLPVQIFQWADLPEKGFVEKTSAAIMVLLAFLIAMNAVAVLLRRKFERKW